MFSFLCWGKCKQCSKNKRAKGDKSLCLPLWSIITQGISSMTLRHNLTLRGLGCELLCRRKSSARHKDLALQSFVGGVQGHFHKKRKSPKPKFYICQTEGSKCCLHTVSFCSFSSLFRDFCLKQKWKKKIAYFCSAFAQLTAFHI